MIMTLMTQKASPMLSEYITPMFLVSHMLQKPVIGRRGLNNVPLPGKEEHYV